MNVNTRFFATYNHRHRQPIVGYRSPLNRQDYQPVSIVKSARASFERTHGKETFLPSIATINDGHKPYYRNDFANNHLFVAKHKLARIFLNQSTMNIQPRSDLLHSFDRDEPEHRNSGMNKYKRKEDKSQLKANAALEHDAHLSIVNLILKPSLPSPQTRHPFSPISYRRGRTTHSQSKAPLPSIVWTNPVMEQHYQSMLNCTIEDDLEESTTINDLVDNNPLNSSLLHVKSIISSAESEDH